MNIELMTQGEILRLLTKRSRKSSPEIAKLLDIHPNHLSKLFKSEKLTYKIKTKASQGFGVDIGIFENGNVPLLQQMQMEVNEDEAEFHSQNIEKMSATDILEYLEEKDRRHWEERGRLLAIIENLTKK